jgi:hypothetical protein
LKIQKFSKLKICGILKTKEKLKLAKSEKIGEIIILKTL